MKLPSILNLSRLRDFFLTLAGIVLALTTVSGQSNPTPPPQERDDVIRVNTDLVQTDVMVFDKKGRFADGLTQDQFVLKIDNKPQQISFFERASSGAGTETRRAAGGALSTSSNSATFIRDRYLLFFVDDLHLAPASLVRTRTALLQFIDQGVGPRDQVAITSSSGQIGFLQQFTNDRVALRSAVARLNYRANTKTDMDNPPMSEYIASKIRDGDEATISYYVSEMMKQNCFKPAGGGGYICMVSTQAARHLVIERAQQIRTQAAPDTDNTLRLLEGLMRTASQLPGRKLVFVISDGFFLNDRESNSRERIKRVTEAAGKAGVIIYTLDARGLIGEGLDVTNNRPVETAGLTVGSDIGETSASQDGLNALARDTGGRPFRNTNRPMSEWVEQVVGETSNYYLLAWRPDNDEQKRGKFNHIEVSINGRPDLTVRLRRGYFKTTPLPILTSRKKADKNPTKAREDDLRLVIDAPVSQRQIPTDLSLNVSQMPGVGTRLTASIEMDRDALTFEMTDGKLMAEVDLGGIFYDDKGKPVNSFVGRLRIFPVPEHLSATKTNRAIYNFTAWLPPGLVQVRVGVRDLKSGRIGSAMGWVQIPNLSSR
jgi:VWFA-related protein